MILGSAHETSTRFQASTFRGNPLYPVGGFPGTMEMMESIITLILEPYSQCYRRLLGFVSSHRREPGPYHNVAPAASFT